MIGKVLVALGVVLAVVSMTRHTIGPAMLIGMVAGSVLFHGVMRWGWDR